MEQFTIRELYTLEETIAADLFELRQLLPDLHLRCSR